MRRHLRKLKKHKRLVLITALLVFGSGCFGAVSKTTQELSNDAMKPVSVPVEAYGHAKAVTNDVNAKQLEENKQIEATK